EKGLSLKDSYFAWKPQYPMRRKWRQNEILVVFQSQIGRATSVGCGKSSRRSPQGNLSRDERNMGRIALDFLLYFRNYRNMRRPEPLLVSRSADRFSALGAEPRLRIVRLLLSAHPTGMVAGEVQEELEIPASTLSHHLEKLKQAGLVNVR